MTLIYIAGQPCLYQKISEPTSIASFGRLASVAKPGDYLLLDRWMNAVIVEAEVMEEFLEGVDDEDPTPCAE